MFPLRPNWFFALNNFFKQRSQFAIARNTIIIFPVFKLSSSFYFLSFLFYFSLFSVVFFSISLEVVFMKHIIFVCSHFGVLAASQSNKTVHILLR